LPAKGTDRIRNAELLGKVVSAETAADLIQDGMTVGICSDLLPLCRALEKQAGSGIHRRFRLWSGVAFLEADRVLGKLGVIERRIGQQTLLRGAINSRKVEYLDTPLGYFYQSIRGGELGHLDLAVVEAVGITPEGHLIPSYRLHDMPNFAQAARKVMVQLSSSYPLAFEGMHDVYLPANPPRSVPIPIFRAGDRIGTPYISVEPDKIACIYVSPEPEPLEMPGSIDEGSRKIARNLIHFLREEVGRGNLPPALPPMEIGLGNIPTAVLQELGQSEFENLEFYSAVLNDGILDLMARGKVQVASGSGFFLSAKGEAHLIQNLEEYKKRIVLRTVEITDCPEVIMRLGILALNGAIEVDIYGNVNSSHIMNGDVVSGVGGASEFALNARLSVILIPSTARRGDVSCIIPMTSHVDVPEHGVDVIVTEHGVADLRGLTPGERAEKIISSCADPVYQPLLQDYFQRAAKEGGGHEPHLLEEAFSFHQRFLKTGSMKK
jgi:succinyl-CoA:acetate CoA-transferase